MGADFAVEGSRWWAHIQYLADDKLEGRNTGSEGYRKAVAYVAGQFERNGLQPAGTDGYLQAVKFETRQLIEKDSTLALVREGKAEPLKFGEEASLTARGETTTPISAAMVFTGSGLHIPEANYDDLAGLDLRGKIAVYVNGGGPKDVPGNLRSHYSSTVERWNAFREAGAIGMATLAGVGPGPNGGGNGGGRQGGPRPPAPPTFSLADPGLQEADGMEISLTISRAGADRFLAGSGHSLEELQKLFNSGQRLPRFPLNGTLQAKASIERGEVSAPNVVGLLPGSDEKLKNEYVIMSAHLDHLGIGRPVDGDSIYNGAMDDASGIASILEIARILKESGAKPRRSLIFLAVAGEEKGELGSRYFAARPTVPARQIVADINLDMFMPLHALKVIEVQGLGESTLGDTIRAAAGEFGVGVQADKEPEQNRFIRSDQYSFIRNGVPALAFKFGYEFGTPEEKIHKDWLRDRYHKPSDDLNQPVDKEAAAQFDRIIASLLNRVANADQRPQWNSDSFFRRFAKGS
jgi:Zn-dependent M28 family amino/carboxypeptidase